MKLPIIQSLWIGDDLTNLEKLCAQSFIDNGHEFHLYTYDKVGGIPAGVVVKDGNDILPRNEIFQYKGGSVAGFADWFRYALLSKNSGGGIWVDMDVVCLKPFNFACDELMLAGCVDQIPCTNSVIIAPPNNPLMQAMLNACAQVKNKQGSKWGSVGGPRVLSEMVERMELTESIKPFYYFVPLSPPQWAMPFDRTFADSMGLFEDSYCVHLSNEMLRGVGLDKNAEFDSKSLFEQLKTKHGIANQSAVNHDDQKTTPAQVHQMQQRREAARTKRIAKQKKQIKLLAALFIALVIGNIVGWWL